MASLFVIQGRDQGTRYDLPENVYHLGRESTNSIQLHDTEVSRRHAELRRETNAFVVVDLGSSNGTYVNSERVERRELASGDRVQLGRTLMIYTAQEQSSSEDLADLIDIVGKEKQADPSRIVKSIGQEEGSNIFQESKASSPWLARARSNLQIMYRTALAVSHTLDIDQLVARILELVFEWVDADRGCVMLKDLETDELMPKAHKARPGLAANDRMSISRTILDYVMQHKEGVLTSDAREDQRWDPEGSILKLGVREAICVPLQGRYGIVGVIYVDTYTPPGRIIQQSQARQFTEEQLKLMVAIGHQAALAVEDTSYYSALVQAERLAAVGQAIAALSHHIKNILQGIRGGSYLIEEGLKDTDSNVVRKGWTIVEKNQEKISNLVLDMLTFSKEREPDPVEANINETVGDVVELMESRAKDAEVELVWVPDEEMPVALFDIDAIHRAVLNVVTNAIDACEYIEQARVTVSTKFDRDADQVKVMVADNGSGIEPEDLQRIFTMFESRKGARGTGLGLSVSQKILREHGGEIEVESELGQGSRFTLSLPSGLPQPTPPAVNGDTHM